MLFTLASPVCSRVFYVIGCYIELYESINNVLIRNVNSIKLRFVDWFGLHVNDFFYRSM